MYTICEVIKDSPIVLGKVSNQETVLGREPKEVGIKLAFDSVSREHAMLVLIDNFLFLKDLNSTNGTWLNGVKLHSGEIKLASVGDTLQLADKQLLISDESLATQSMPSMPKGVWVFDNMEFLGFKESTFSMPTIVFFGNQIAHTFDKDSLESSSLIIVDGDRGFYARKGTGSDFNSAIEVLVANNTLKTEAELKHNDNIRIADFRLVVCNPSSLRQGTEPVFSEILHSNPDSAARLRDWDNPDAETRLLRSRDSIQSSVFGTVDGQDFSEESELSGNLEIDRVQSAIYEKIERRLIVLVFVVLLAAILTITLWWFLANR
ncbi:MAG: FHA domain-containing protein [Bdellovibrionales bacterium]|nr:FHA domain-containing protein [Bdellovibrionales bacterium]